MKEYASKEKRQRRRVFLVLFGALVLVVAVPAIIAIWYLTGAIHNRALSWLVLVLIATMFVAWLMLSIWAEKH